MTKPFPVTAIAAALLLSSAGAFAPAVSTLQQRQRQLATPVSFLQMAKEEEGGGQQRTGLLNRILRRNKQEGFDDEELQEEQQQQEDATTLLNAESEMKQVMNPEADMQTDDVDDNDKNDTQNLLAKIKAAGKAGVISYALWELAFWLFSVPVAVLGYVQFSGHWPDFSNKDDLAGVGAEAFAFVNFARFAVPLRIGLALSSVGWVQDNVVDKFFPEEDGDESKEE